MNESPDSRQLPGLPFSHVRTQDANIAFSHVRTKDAGRVLIPLAFYIAFSHVRIRDAGAQIRMADRFTVKTNKINTVKL